MEFASLIVVHLMGGIKWGGASKVFIKGEEYSESSWERVRDFSEEARWPLCVLARAFHF